MGNKAKYVDENAIFDIEVEKISKTWDPVRDQVWGSGQLPSITKIRNRCNKGNTINTPGIKLLKTYDHSARIAYFVQNLSDEPISIEVTEDGCIYVVDGNHRLAAAIFTKRKTISCVVGGWCSVAEELFDIEF